MSNIIAIIPARGGSKGITKKNIRILDGHPLIYYQISAALNSKYISKVYVSTDCEQIASVAKQYHNVEVIYRPDNIADDLSKSEEAIIHALNQIEKTSEPVELVVFLQATSPLNKTEYIDLCIEKLLSGYDSVCTAIEDFGFFLNTSEIINRPMRQNKIPLIRECGNCWVFKKEIITKYNNRLGGKIGYIIINKWDALEIDDPEDIIPIKAILQKRNRIKNQAYFTKRQPDSYIDYEEGYWATTVDPDGLTRNKIDERETFIQDAKIVLDYINTLTPGKVLDIGCGFGFLLSAINNKWEKHGTEVSSYASNIAGQYANVFTGDLLDAQYEHLSFDLIILYNVIEHLKDPITYINKIHDLLTITGKLIISTPDFDCITAKRFKENFRLLHDKSHISLFSTKSLCLLLEDCGFEIDKIDYPFFEGRHFNKENLLRLFDCSKISPPFYGNVVNIFAQKS